ncbi:hypothetical protein [Streptomyces somaliensis]|uniref:hypothetical protein n=1 Tax=Streptomyces somaliensis TaxID=78355 RepID=UPI0034E98855|nr:hypothetical protein [Streptomyces somaliensis]
MYLLPTWCYFLWNLKIPVSRRPRSRGRFNMGWKQSLDTNLWVLSRGAERAGRGADDPLPLR